MDTTQEKALQDFTEALEKFDTVLEDMPSEGLNWAEKEGEWTIREVIHHVAEDCNVYAFIIERALATPGCNVVFGEFPGNLAWGKAMDWQTRAVEPARELMHAHRAFLTEMVGSFPDRWSNQVHFKDESGKDLGEQTVAGMMKMLTEHMEEHTAMIAQILAAHS